MSISSFGGASSDAGSSSSDIGQLIQAVGGDNFLPADGRIINKTDYPKLHEILSAPEAASSLVFNLFQKTLGGGVGTFKIAYCASIDTYAAIETSSGTNRVHYSKDGGNTWFLVSIINNTGSPITWKDIVANSFGFCAMGTGGGPGVQTLFSSDGVNWQMTLLNSSHNYLTTSIYVVNDEFRISYTTYGGTRSVDGINWINESLQLGGNSNIMKSSAGLINFGYTNANNTALGIFLSTDNAASWTSTLSTTPEAVLAWSAYQNKAILLTATRSFTSEDGGLTWATAAHDLPAIISANGMCRLESGWVTGLGLTGRGPLATMYYSDNGVNWINLANAPMVTTSGSLSISCIAKNGSTLVCPIKNAGCVIYSTDGGVTWDVATLPTNAFWSQCIWNGTYFVVLAPNSATSYKSVDGVTWTIASASVPVLAAAGSSFGYTSWNYNSTLGLYTMVYGTASTAILTSPDAITWTQRVLPSSQIWTGLASKGGTIVVLSSGTAAASSTDGITFTSRVMSASANWEVAATDTTFVAVGRGATGASIAYGTSPDGVTWTARTMTPLSTVLTIAGITASGTRAIMFDRGGNAYTSNSAGLVWNSYAKAVAATTSSSYGSESTQLQMLNGVLTMLLTNSVNGKAMLVEVSDFANLTGATAKNTIFGGANHARFTNIPGTDSLIGIFGQIKFQYVRATQSISYSKLPDILDTAIAEFGNPVWNGTEFIFTTTNNVFGTFPLLRSTDGQNWTRLNAPVSALYGTKTKGRYQVVAAPLGSGMYSSVDGNAWEFSASPNNGSPNSWNHATIDDKLWIIPVSSVSNMLLCSPITTSADGKTLVLTVPNGNPSMVASDGFNIIAVGIGGMGSVSSDGKFWTTPVTIPLGLAFIVYNPISKLFIAVASTGNIVYTSPDGKIWTQRTFPGPAITPTGFAQSGRVIMLVGSSNSSIAYSPNGGNTWFNQTETSRVYKNLVADAKGNFVGHAATTAQVMLYAKGFDEATQAVLPTIVASPQWFVKAK